MPLDLTEVPFSSYLPRATGVKMHAVNRSSIAGLLMLLPLLAARPVLAPENAHVDLTGTWLWINHEDERDRNPGAFPGDYRGLPLNDAARMRADTYDEEVNTSSSLLPCRPRTPGYQPKGLDPMRIDKVTDPLTRQLVAYRISYEKTSGERVIWVDGRPSPSPYALHSWDGFSTGKLRGDTLEITTTHIKERYVRRNGVATSFRATVVEQLSLEEPYLEVTFTVIDPDYLTEPLLRSATHMRPPTAHAPPAPHHAPPPPGAAAVPLPARRLPAGREVSCPALPPWREPIPH